MALPKHKYYTLKQAAKKAGCEVEDLIHFAAIGMLQLCIKAPDLSHTRRDEDNQRSGSIFVKFESESSLRIDEAALLRDNPYPTEAPNISDMAGIEMVNDTIESHEDEYDDEDEDEGDYPLARFWVRFRYNSEFFSCVESYELYTRTKKIEKWNGLLAIPKEEISIAESVYERDVSTIMYIDNFLRPRCDSEFFDETFVPRDFYSDEWVDIDLNKAVITHYELGLLLSGGVYIDEDILSRYSSEYPANENKIKTIKKENFSKNKASLIKSLTELAFADDGGISKLSMESLATQLQQKFEKNKIEHDIVSPSNIRNWIGKVKDGKF